jgi:thiamine biosynthesis lipoprotein
MADETNPKTASRVRALLTVVLLATFAGTILLGVWKDQRMLTARRHAVEDVMSTDGQIRAVFQPSQYARAVRTLSQAEDVLREVELLMSSHRPDSEISRLNDANAGPVELSPSTMDVLLEAREIWRLSGGAFDVTIGPVLDVWKQAAARDHLPDRDALYEAREASRWEHLELSGTVAIKQRNTLRVDLGGIAKGYAVDRAVELMQRRSVKGGLVELGGDLRCFGAQHDGSRWRVGVQDPFHTGPGSVIGILELDPDVAGAVCTSGPYRRPVTIAGEEFSHILDPRPETPYPVESSASVTVIAPTCMAADAWATALSVLGPEGLELLDALDEPIEAMLIVGTPESHQLFTTDGFNMLPVPAPATKPVALGGPSLH